jgi:hypothetical protein
MISCYIILISTILSVRTAWHIGDMVDQSAVAFGLVNAVHDVDVFFFFFVFWLEQIIKIIGYVASEVIICSTSNNIIISYILEDEKNTRRETTFSGTRDK